MYSVQKVEINGVECVKIMNLQHFDLSQIMFSGQCFRIYQYFNLRRNDNTRSYLVLHFRSAVRIDALGELGVFIFHCSETEFHSIWERYFCLDEDYYEPVREILAQHPDPFLEQALEYGKGIRILRQDLYEMFVTFMISQNNNIKRISSSVNSLCMMYEESHNYRGTGYFPFPRKERLIGKNFLNLGLGYRSSYLAELFRDQSVLKLISDVANADHDEAKKRLMQVKGIGNKVADCICLYGRHDMESYPIDTWMKKMIDEVYGGHFDVTPYQRYAGYVQQLQFFYYRSLKRRRKNA